MTWLYLAYGVGFICAGIVWGITSLTYVTSKEVNGTVIRTLQRPRGGIRPEVEYEVNAKRFSVVARCWTSSSWYRVGDRVRVFHKADDPASAKLASFLELWFFPLGATICGMTFLLVGLSALRRVILRRRLNSTSVGENVSTT